MDKPVKIALFVLVAVLSLAIWIGATHTGRAAWNTYFGSIQKVDDRTNYNTKKEIEDSCRAMIASYEADRLTYEQYKDEDNDDKQEWASQAKMRANKTASSYNNYVLKNSYVWDGNIPKDISSELDYIE